MSDIDNEELYTVLTPAKSPSVTISTHQRPREDHDETLSETFSAEG